MERSEIRTAGRWGAGDGQAGKALVGQLQVGSRARRLAVPIEARLELLDETQLADLAGPPTGNRKNLGNSSFTLNCEIQFPGT